MTRFAATYFDGRSSDSCPVEVSVDKAGEFLVHGSGFELRYRLAEVEVASRIGKTPRSIYFPDGGKCETLDNDALDEALADLRSERPARLLHAFESRLPLIVAALRATVLLGWASLEHGLPYLAREVAHALPREVDERLGRGAMQGLDHLVFEPSGLDPDVQDRLRATFAELVAAAETETAVRLEFRSARAMGPNALALPSGIVAVTDEPVALAASDQEILAVLAHEPGHIEARHAVRSALWNAITPVLLETVTGDLTPVTALSATLATFLIQMKHSRAFEREADDYARAMLARMGIPREPLIAILERLSEATPVAPTMASAPISRPIRDSGSASSASRRASDRPAWPTPPHQSAPARRSRSWTEFARGRQRPRSIASWKRSAISRRAAGLAAAMKSRTLSSPR